MKINLDEMIRRTIVKLQERVEIPDDLVAPDGYIWVSFNSHRTREKAERLYNIDVNDSVTSLRYNGHWNLLTTDQFEQIKNMKGVISRKKLVGKSDEWLNSLKFSR